MQGFGCALTSSPLRVLMLHFCVSTELLHRYARLRTHHADLCVFIVQNILGVFSPLLKLINESS